MLVLLADTHGTESPRLQGRTAEAVAAADAVVHAGDFTTTAVYEAIRARVGGVADEAAGGATSEATDESWGGAAGTLHAVHGNSDEPPLKRRLPAVETFEALDRRFVVAHGHRHGRTSLSLLARQEDADCVVVGHTHSWALEDLGGVTLVNPGSHADPRGAPATHAEVERTAGTVSVAVVTTAGEQCDEVVL